MNGPAGARTLCIVVCGAGPASRVNVLVALAQREGWTVRIVATPSGLTFLDADGLAEQCGGSVRSDYRSNGPPGERSSAADAVIVAPATYNSINKLAAGINDTYALNVVAEAIGRGTPVAILPFVNSALASRRPFLAAVQSLRSEGVRLLLGTAEWQPHPPGEGERMIDSYPWHVVLAAINDGKSPPKSPRN